MKSASTVFNMKLLHRSCWFKSGALVADDDVIDDDEIMMILLQSWQLSYMKQE